MTSWGLRTCTAPLLYELGKTKPPYVGADLGIMEADTNRVRPEKPWVFTNLKTLNGLDDIIEFIRHYGVLTWPRAQIKPLLGQQGDGFVGAKNL